MVKAIKVRPSCKRFRLVELDHDQSVPKRYRKKLAKLQDQIRQIHLAYLHAGKSAAIVFEGWDAAGKGGTIRRMSSMLDPRGFKVWPIGAPRRRDAERHYLARFWQRLPPRGAISVFDRSWYGRVLVERVEEIADPPEWQRAYDEINQFEHQLLADEIRVIKLFLHITKDEQYRRFQARFHDPQKRWKLTGEDLRNRERWDDYEAAVEEMVRRTSTDGAPWHVVPANNKKFARLDCLQTIAERLTDGVEVTPPPLDEEVKARAVELFDNDVG